jgi:hypothetical protein
MRLRYGFDLLILAIGVFTLFHDTLLICISGVESGAPATSARFGPFIPRSS